MILLACGLIGVGLAWVMLAKREPEPSYKGRTLSQWYLQWAKSSEHDDDGFTAQRNEAADAIRQIGTKALPILVNRLKLQAAPSPVRETLWGLVNRLPGDISHSRIASSVFLDADKVEPTSTFVILGAQAAPAIPELTRFLTATNTPDLIHSAVYCLAAIGDEGLPPLLAVLADPQHPARYDVAYWLGLDASFRLGTNLSQTVPLLAQCAAAADQRLAEAAVKALGHIHQEPEISIPALATCLTSTNAIMRTKAIRSLARFGEAAVPYLITALKDSDASVCRVATHYLQLIAPEALTNAPPQ
jgi:HEAT repeat protein